MSSKNTLLPFIVLTALLIALPASSAVQSDSLRDLIVEKNNIVLDGDANSDYVVDMQDFAAVEESYGTSSASSDADLNGDGQVDIYDLKAVGINYGGEIFAAAAAGSGGAIIYVSPSTVNVEPGETFQVNVMVDTNESIFGGSLRLSFNKDVIVGTFAEEGNFLKSDGATTYPIISIDNETGIVSYDTTRFGTDYGVSGNDSVLIVTFRAIAVGTSDIMIYGYELVDESLYVVSINSVSNGTAVVQVNRAPVISSYSPASLTPSVNEGSALPFSVSATDPDSDPLSYSWRLDGTQVSTSASYTYSPGYSSSGLHTVVANVSDGTLSATVTWQVTVNDVQITCSQNSDCGTDGYVTSNFCLGNNVARTYRTYTCNSPGTPAASCSQSDANITQQACSYRCISGSCVTNQPPSIIAYSPLGSSVAINEGESQGFSVTASDPYSDPLTYSWMLSGSSVSSTASYTYTSNYNSAGTYTVLANVSDGVFSVSRTWTLVVNNVNRAPVINSYSPTNLTPSVNEGQNLAFSVSASDPDGDSLSYQWRLDGAQVSTSSSYTYSPSFSAAGTHTMLVNVTDAGKLFATQQWTVTVKDVQITCSQNSDCGTDGYTGSAFCSGLNVMRTYRTYTCNSPGTPAASCSSADNNVILQTCGFQCSAGACVTNGNPVISPIGNRQATEGIVLSFPVTATDPDGHSVTLSVTSGPGSFSGNSYTYTPPLDANHVGEVSTVTVLASDGYGGTDTESFILTVTDVNRIPVINAFSPVSLTPSVNEGASQAFSIAASDADGDALSYSWKLDGATVSTTSGYTYSPGYDASGAHTVVSAVSDGYGGTATKTWTVTVNNVGTVTLHLFYGANTVNLPARPVDTSVTAVLSSVSGKYTSASVYDPSIVCNEATVCVGLTAAECQAACESLRWLIYNPSRPAHLNTLKNIDGTLPFFINMNQDAVLTVNI